MALYPVPTTRSSDILSRSRLVAQIQADSLALLRLQSQLSTGYRIQAPSEDPTAALRAQGIQRLLELKGQVKTNLNTSQSFLSATDTAISNVTTMLSNARALAVEAAGVTASPEQRRAAAVEVGRILEQLVDAGNQEFRGRYLFAGSQMTERPFSFQGNYVRFEGNQGAIRSYADNDLLFDSNIGGHAMFGTISVQQRGTVDLNPVLTTDTLLADLNGGRGVRSGSISISDGSTTKTIDISSAETIGDIAALIEANPPNGRTVTARVGAEGLIISLDAAGSGQLTISEVSGGTTAAELGIKSAGAIGTGPLNGADLNPVLRPTTRLDQILGVRAAGILTSAGTNNDIVFTSLTNGSAENGVTVQFVDDSLLHASPGLIAGDEAVSYSDSATPARAAVEFSGLNNNLVLTANTPGTSLNNVQIVIENAGAIGNDATVSYDSTDKILHVGVDSSGATDVQTLINRINAEGTFNAAYDASDAADGGFVPTATIPAADAGVVTGNTSNSGAAASTFLVAVAPGATTATHVVSALNGDAAFAARFAAQLDQKDTTSPALAGQGLIDLDSSAATAGGSGADLDQASGLRIRNGQETFDIDISSANTLEELLNVINGSGASVLAEINESATGINIRSLLSGADLSIGESGGTTATQLGIRSLTLATPLSTLNYGRGVNPLGGTDFTIHRNDGVALNIDVSSATTLGDVLDLINNHPLNLDPATQVVARLAQFGNGIELVDDNPVPGFSLRIEQAFGSHVAEELGLVPRGTDDSVPATLVGTSEQLTGSDSNPIEVGGVFTALIRIKDALEANNIEALERASELLDSAFEDVNFARGEIGARSQSLDTLEARLEDEEVELKKNLSDEIEVDMVKTVSDLTARQAQYQATLQLSANLAQLTLLNYL